MIEKFVVVRLDSATLAIQYVYIPDFNSYNDALEFMKKVGKNSDYKICYQINKVFH